MQMINKPDTHADKLLRFKMFMESDQYRSGLIGFQSYEEIARQCYISTWTATRYIREHYPGTALRMKRLRSLA
jgi:hypothetical protein